MQNSEEKEMTSTICGRHTAMAFAERLDATLFIKILMFSYFVVNMTFNCSQTLHTGSTCAKFVTYRPAGSFWGWWQPTSPDRCGGGCKESVTFERAFLGFLNLS